MLDFGKSTITYFFNPDSFFQKSPSGISYRIPKKWLDLFNQHIRRVAEKAVEVAKSHTPFRFFRGDWSKKLTYGGKLGIVDTITIFNKKSNDDMPYQSQYSNSGRTYYFPVYSSMKPSALRMLEEGRKRNYTIVPKNGDWLTTPPGTTSRLSSDKTTSFAKKVKIKKRYPHVTKPLTKTLNFMRDSINDLFGKLKTSGIEYTTLSQVKPSQLGAYTRIPKTETRNTRGKR